jgi:hypothetical protein
MDVAPEPTWMYLRRVLEKGAAQPRVPDNLLTVESSLVSFTNH